MSTLKAFKGLTSFVKKRGLFFLIMHFQLKGYKYDHNIKEVHYLVFPHTEVALVARLLRASADIGWNLHLMGSNNHFLFSNIYLQELM